MTDIEARDPSDQDPLLAALPGLIRDLAASAVVELDLSVGDARLYVRQRPGPPPALPALGGPAAGGAPDEDAGLVPVASPLAGVFYAAPSPDDAPYVAVGDEVESGQVIALVEAMKVFNEIHAEVAGVVVKIVVAPGQQVETGQALMLLSPNRGDGDGAV
jgi:acetyl-CoA carboxylase biotin carboxyl carrier protein